MKPLTLNISLQFAKLSKMKKEKLGENIQFSATIKKKYLLNFLLQLFKKLFIFFL